ncbi:MAG TPA: elongation factor P [Phycisphaerae bacterium]|nr:elongation factor P [Phycisphaerae bacterium]HNU44083.1 elongation factor P [Phycisphaerae bacterium]
MIKAVDLRKGKTILHEGEVCVVHEAQHVAKGNKRSYMQARIKNIKTGTIVDVRFNVDDRVEVPFVETREYEYLYREGDHFVLMDMQSFDQVNIRADVVGDAGLFLKPNERVSCQLYNGQQITFELPLVVELEVVDTPPVVKGATVTNQPKEARLETGARIRVPAFIAPGERVRVDTRTGQYVERAK